MGALTGSRTAGLCGRIPVEATVAARNAEWIKKGLTLDTCTLTVATYVDNIYAVSTNARFATVILDDFESQLI